MNTRFTIDGSPQLEQHLERICLEVRQQIQEIVPANKLEAIYLGGGYGRGEGGVLKCSGGDRPYNDLEFYVCIRGVPRLNERVYGTALHELGEELTPIAGIEVEFKIISLAQISKSPPSMFLYDLAMGHRTLLGDDTVLRQPKFRDASQIPLHEATRLLMNRCSGLLFSEEKLLHAPFTSEDADFVGRNHAKAQLAFGDVVLTVLGKYHWSCRERSKRLQALAENNSLPEFPVPLTKVLCHHRLGVEFKLHPRQSSGSAEEFIVLQNELRELGRHLWLWLESRRLQRRFSEVEDYALNSMNKCPETNPLKNRLINLRHGGVLGILGIKGGRYPRERILNTLPLLLWDPAVRQRAGHMGRIQEELNTTSSDFVRLIDAYSAIWRQFN